MSFPPLPLEWLLHRSQMSFFNVPKEFQPWIYSIFGAILIGVAGVFPLAFIPLDYGFKRKNSNEKFDLLQLTLSFAVGGLLSDVFLHLLPEAWTTAIEGGSTPQEAFTDVGLCVLCGIFIFIIVEMLVSSDKSSFDCNENNNTKLDAYGHSDKKVNKSRPIKVIGYLNLIANGIDNFAHGLAVAGSFLVSYKTGVVTTAAILIHEIPHEIGDFAILLNSGFSRWEAAKAQLYTASIGLVGALITLILGTSNFLGGLQVYVLGFTAGGFLNIALVSVLPGLLKEERPSHSAVQLLSLVFGIVTMAAVAFIC